MPSAESSKGKLVTVIDVARVAGVAVGTVSRVLNQEPTVNEEARARVLQVVRKLGYKRIRQHRKMSEVAPDSAQGNVGVVIFGMEGSLVEVPVVSAALHGVERELSARGGNLMLANIPRGDQVPAFVRDRGVRGLILKGPNQGPLPEASQSELVAALAAIPHVWLMGRPSNATGDHANFDADFAGQLAAAHFGERGHRRVAILNPKPGQHQFEKLQRGFLDFARQAGLEATVLGLEPPRAVAWPLPAITSEENVRLLAEKWYRTPASRRPSGLFCVSDRTAVQLYGALMERGVRVPRDVSVISCNNETSLISGLNPGLTSIEVNAEAVGRRAVEQLFRRVAEPGDPLNTTVLVEPRLVVRDSVGPAP